MARPIRAHAVAVLRELARIEARRMSHAAARSSRVGRMSTTACSAVPSRATARNAVAASHEAAIADIRIAAPSRRTEEARKSEARNWDDSGAIDDGFMRHRARLPTGSSRLVTLWYSA